MHNKHSTGDRSTVYLSKEDRAKAADLINHYRLTSLAALVRFLVNQAHQSVPPPLPARPAWQVNWVGYPYGASNICAGCKALITFNGEYWVHEGIAQPRHIGMPSTPPEETS